MALSEVKVLQATVRSFKMTIESESNPKNNHVSIQLADHYNSLVQKASKFPDIASHLPPTISTRSNFAALGVTEATLTDLKVYLNQLLALAEVLQEG